MAKLVFKNADLKSVIKHTQDGKIFSRSFSEAIQAYQQETKKKYDFNVDLDKKFLTTTVPSLLLVKDSGIYIMTAAEFKEIPKDESHVAYAVGYNPKVSDVWEKCREAVGGDDFAESFELEDWMIKVIAEGKGLVVTITTKSMKIAPTK